MNKKFRSVFLIASITAVCILVFQMYWIFNSYKTAEKNLKNNIENILNKGIETYQFSQLDLAPVLRNDDLTVYYATKKRYVNPKDKSKENSPYYAEMNSIKIPEEQLPAITAMLSKLKASVLKTINLNDLNSVIKEEFLRNNINLDFSLSLVHDEVPLRDTFYIPVHLSKKNMLVRAQIKNMNMYLLKQNVVPLLVSMVLILLSAGSLYFMAITIKRQLKLDELKNDFINNMTHELRTPISILKSSNEALLSFNGINDPEKAIRYLKINDDILNKLDHNVDRILDIVQYNDRKLSVNLVKINPDDVIVPIINRFVINENIRIEYINQLRANEIYTDVFIIDTILSNLFDNSIKYAVDQKVNILLKISSLENGFQLYVQDNGKGIDPLYLPYIFDKFFRVPEGNIHDVKGYGLGLNYVKKLVKDLSGNIAVKSELAVGTIFTIKFKNS
ncbi:sensor histidine kinase [Chryseobacterium kwangjuense]|uniref:histidine kinase n=1 Tax=Chryseobacterium kwangjuense TaxID=267125 RepID=A0A135W1C7_9FLAO|nr:HAMP domain-containing sensor histidine kinase [Chryseobacterium kwangjuense]KXH78522.1 hypothetical protein AU378_22210 [Chryseobacterium kwangjuense]